MLDVEKENFRRRFPNLSGEVDEEAGSLPPDPAASEEANSQSDGTLAKEIVHKKPMRGFDGYDPTTVDFLRRCGSEKEAQEIIEYMEKKGEIARSEAQRMRSQLKTKGLRSFGPKKDYGYYLKILE